MKADGQRFKIDGAQRYMADHQTDGRPVGYMERTRLYCRALAYETDYVWSTYDDVPFTRLWQPLTDVKLALLTTAVRPI